MLHVSRVRLPRQAFWLYRCCAWDTSAVQLLEIPPNSEERKKMIGRVKKCWNTTFLPNTWNIMLWLMRPDTTHWFTISCPPPQLSRSTYISLFGNIKTVSVLILGCLRKNIGLVEFFVVCSLPGTRYIIVCFLFNTNPNPRKMNWRGMNWPKWRVSPIYVIYVFLGR